MLPETLILKLNTYNLLIGIGIISAFLVLFFYCKIKNVDFDFYKFITLNGIVSLAVGFIFASLFQSLYNYLSNKNNGFILGGYTFIGGLIGGSICFLIIYFCFSKNYSQKLSSVISIIPCCITIGHAFGRLGCFCAGCCYGVETDSFLGVNFPNLNAKVYPTQLYESLFLFVLFFVFSYLVLKKDYKQNLSLYLILYGVFRFFIEFLRGDERGVFIGSITPSQFWCIISVIIGILLIAIDRFKFRLRRNS